MSSAFFCEDRKINGQNLALENVWKNNNLSNKRNVATEMANCFSYFLLFPLGK
jgi:hypothetical protein